MINNSASHSSVKLSWGEQKNNFRVTKNKFTEKDIKPKELTTTLTGLQALKNISVNHSKMACRKDEHIYRENRYPIGIYLVTQGRVKTYKIHEQGKAFITGIYHAGDFLGYSALLEDIHYADSAMAMDDSEICLIPKEDFCSLIYTNAEVSRTILKMLSHNLRLREELLTKLAYSSVRKRVAEALVALANCCKKIGAQKFEINISRKDLASIVGTAPETAIRVLSDFKDEGLVNIKAKGGIIAVAQYDRLAHMRN